MTLLLKLKRAHREIFLFYSINYNVNLLLKPEVLEFFSCRLWKTDISLVSVSSRIGRSEMLDFEFSSSRAFEMMIRGSRKHLDQSVALIHGVWPVISHALRVLISGAVYNWQGLSGSLSIGIKSQHEVLVFPHPPTTSQLYERGQTFWKYCPIPTAALPLNAATLSNDF